MPAARSFFLIKKNQKIKASENYLKLSSPYRKRTRPSDSNSFSCVYSASDNFRAVIFIGRFKDQKQNKTLPHKNFITLKTFYCFICLSTQACAYQQRLSYLPSYPLMQRAGKMLCAHTLSRLQWLYQMISVLRLLPSAAQLEAWSQFP